MLTQRLHHPRRGSVEEADDPEPGSLPVEPDEGPTQPIIPADPEGDRVVDPRA